MSIVSQTFGVAGQVDVVPRRVQLTVTDNLATLTTPGYLTEKGISPYSVYPTDVFDIIYSFNVSTGVGTYGEFLCITTSAGRVTLFPAQSTNEVVAWTPTLSFGGNSVGITYSAQIGTYVANGNVLNFTVDLILTSKGSSTGIATISLPFLPIGGSISSIQSQNVTFTNTPQALIDIAVNTIGLEQNISGSTVSALTNSNFSNNSTLFFSGWYEISPQLT